MGMERVKIGKVGNKLRILVVKFAFEGKKRDL